MSIEEQLHEPGSVLVNILDWTELGASAEQSRIINEESLRPTRYVIVNAPRPLPCAIIWKSIRQQLNLEWRGPYHHGTFYAAGHLDEPVNPFGGGPTFRQRWHELDAWQVRCISNAAIHAMLREHYATAFEDTDGALFDEAIEMLGGMEAVAAMYNLPWREEVTR